MHAQSLLQRILLTALVLAAPVLPAGAADLDVDNIVRKANHASLYQGQDATGRIELTITDSQGRVRKREMAMLRRDENNDAEQQYYVYFLEPADVRKMVFMVHKHTAPGQDDDRWLYMPSLDLVKRIAASDKRTSFVGSDFLYEDISGRAITEDNHELIGETDTEYILDNVPKTPESVEFSHYFVHVDKKTFLPMRLQFFREGNRAYRTIEVTRVENVQAKENDQSVVYPTVAESVARNLDSGSATVMSFSRIGYNQGLQADLFTERYLRRPPRELTR
ncbi:hypothetical protein H4684_002909 [Desulfomicrobium macestii]|uniref:Uncharacterized protein TP-0789 domain-containing protein n=1 Tax=Desulfomicrobium macestii TaxID=90731 RepID=A0ABR9H6E0_9BACT|nr:outer membrane lipoprotein-sorting protein [Desulfomicrobium macestii]MBE1426245.1 hypothetical protein [Desulfomicrobium macestii]